MICRSADVLCIIHSTIIDYFNVQITSCDIVAEKWSAAYDTASLS